MTVSRIRKRLEYIYGTPERVFVFALAVLALFYLPAFICLYPGTLGYDGPVQLAMYYGEQQITMHHPVFHTWLLGSLISIGKTLFGSYNAGLAFYCAIQGGIVILSLAGAFGFLRRYNVSFKVIIILLLWTAWNPYLQAITFATTKDVLFGAFFLDFLLLLMMASEKNMVHEKRIFILLGCAALLTCLTRNQGIYLIAGICLPVLFMRMKKILFILAGAVCCMLCISFINTHFLYIPKGDAKEMLSVPMQQVARVLNETETAVISDEQREKVLRVIPQEGIDAYSAWTADPVKSYLRTNELKQDISGYLHLYLQLGAQNSGIYFKAFDELVRPYFILSRMRTKPLAFIWTFPELTGNWEFQQKDYFHMYYRLLVGSIDPVATSSRAVMYWIQPVMIVFQPVITIILLLILLIFAVIRRNWGVLVLCLAGVLYLVTMLLGPVALIRYAYPLMMQTPLYAGLGVVLRPTGSRRLQLTKESEKPT